MLKQATLDFLGDWLTSTSVLLFYPSGFATSRGKTNVVSPTKDLAFAASSVVVAVALFQTIQRNNELWDAKRDAIPFALAEICLWCLYALITAGLLRILKGEEQPLNNTCIVVRSFSVFYIVATLLGTMVYKASANNAYAFYMTAILIDWAMQVVYFPAVFVGLNRLKGWAPALFILLNLVVATGRALMAVAIAHPFGEPGPWELKAPAQIFGAPLE